MFSQTLKQVVEEAGASGAAVLSFEGLCLQAVDGQGNPVAASGIHQEYANVFKQLRFVGETVDLGDAGELTIAGDEHTTVARALSERYLVVMNVPADALIGKAHFHLRVAAPDLAREL